MKKILSILLLLIMPLTLMHCSFFSPVKTDADHTYVLSSVAKIKTHRKINKTLLVLLPETSPIYDTNEIAYSLGPHKINYFAKNRWVQTPGIMLHPLIIQVLQPHFHAVVTPAFASLANLILYTKIIKLEQNFCNCPSTVTFILRAQLIDAGRNRVIATREFIVMQKAPANNPYGGVIAANRATALLLKQLTEFVLSHSG